jgi:DNA modification methylase
MPLDLASKCIAHGCPEGGLVLDPFVGAGTTLRAASRLRRRALGFEVSPECVVRAARQLGGICKVRPQAVHPHALHPDGTTAA